MAEEWIQKCRKMEPFSRSSSKNCQNLMASVVEFLLESLSEGFARGINESDSQASEAGE
ncbi:hypothetical protein [Bartonella sp. B39]